MTFKSFLKANAYIVFGVLAIVVAVFVIYVWSNPQCGSMSEAFLDMANWVTGSVTGSSYSPNVFQQEYQQMQTAEQTSGISNVQPMVAPGTQNAGTLQEIYGASASTFQESYAPKQELSPQDLLPNPNPVNFVGGENLGAKNFLSAGSLAGINNLGAGKRNPNLQLRSDPPIPQMVVSPWNQTTIMADPYQRPFEIGSSGATMGL